MPDENNIPESEDMVLRLSCHQLHYGLCLESDKQIYKHALQVATDIEHCVKSKEMKAVGRAFSIKDPAKPLINKFIFVCHSTMQTTVVLAKMQSRWPSGTSLDSLNITDEDESEQFDFETPWAFAKAMLIVGAQTFVAEAVD